MKKRTFWSNEIGSLRETTAVAVAVIALAGVGAASGLDYLTKSGALPHIAIIPASSTFAQQLDGESPTKNEEIVTSVLDDSPVGSIPARMSRPIILNPCSGHQE
jgi:hypothetical protein